MFKKIAKTHLLLVLISSLLLCECTTAVNPPLALEPDKKMENPYSVPIADYLVRATTQKGDEKQHTLISAAGALIFKGQWRQGSAILAQTNHLTPSQQDEKNLLLAQVEVIRDRPEMALGKLKAIKNPEHFSSYQQMQFHELKAQAYSLTGMYSDSIFERITLEQILVEKKKYIHNQKNLWFTLTTIPEEDLNALASGAAQGSELQGWIQLALVSRKYRDNSQSLITALDDWQTHHNAHPANHLLPEPLDSIASKLLLQPRKIALLLPLTGMLAGPGKAIHEGFMAAFKANNPKNAPEIKVYDTDKGEITQIYQEAIKDGADYVVGPLLKSQVAVIAAIPHPVPTLLLNDSDVALQENTWLFGLSPANEAIQVAIKARSKGYSRALVIAPDNAWGDEITKVFKTQWQRKGGLVVDTFQYGVNDDMNKKMRDFLQITDSQNREKQIKEILGQKIQTSTSRRQDFDVLFLLAYPSKARQIMPLLKYYYAGDVPVYATSSVYSGSANALKDKDLDGVMFCDIPWVFSHQMGTRNWPEQWNSYNRLYALGMDSYALATQLNQLLLFPADTLGGTNGIIYLKPARQVARVLEWGKFQRGLAHSLEG